MLQQMKNILFKRITIYSQTRGSIATISSSTKIFNNVCVKFEETCSNKSSIRTWGNHEERNFTAIIINHFNF